MFGTTVKTGLTRRQKLNVVLFPLVRTWTWSCYTVHNGLDPQDLVFSRTFHDMLTQLVCFFYRTRQTLLFHLLSLIMTLICLTTLTFYLSNQQSSWIVSICCILRTHTKSCPHKKLLLRALLFTIILFTYIRLQQSQTWWSQHRWKLHTCSFLIPWALSHLCADTDGWWCSTENLCSYLKQSAPQLRCFARRQLEWWFHLLAIWRSVEVSRFHSTLLWCFYFPGRASVCQFLVYAPGLHLEVF